MGELSDLCETSIAPREVSRRYRREMIVASLFYVGVIFISVYVARHFTPPRWASVGLALASAAPVFMMMRAYGRFFEGLDEFQRRVQSDALATAVGIVGFAALTYGFLESFAGFPVFEGALIWVLPAIAIVHSIAAVFVRRRYQ
ncbi:MAG: hypothetical protein ABL864_03540 [Terricaulis sp.]|jgi:hypothetical protein